MTLWGRNCPFLGHLASFLQKEGENEVGEGEKTPGEKTKLVGTARKDEVRE